MNKTLDLLLFFILLCDCSYGQKPQTFEESIRIEIEDKNSAYFYPNLISKIRTQPDKITQEEIKYLYYGQIYNSGTGLAFLENPDEGYFRKAVMRSNCKKAVKYGYSIFDKSPVSLTALMHLNNCRKKLNLPDQSYFLDHRLKLILDVILSTGDGRTKDTAIKIANIEDDYIVKGVLGFLDGVESLDFKDNKAFSVWTKDGQKLYFEDSWSYKYK
jgi:hypothetical protein